MSLECTIRALAEEGTVAALQEHLPKLLASAVLPADPDRLYTYAQAAELMGVPESCIRERVRVGDLWVVELGKYRRIPQRAITALIQRQELRATFRQDQQPVSSDLDAEIDALLASPSVSAKKKARRSERRAKPLPPPSVAGIERNKSMIHPAAIFFLACMGGLAGLGVAYTALHVLIRLGVMKEHGQ